MKCQALIDDWEHAQRYNLSRVINAPATKPCSRDARTQIKHLHLCATHARLAEEGLVDETGRVAPRYEINLVHKHPSKFPHGLHTWATSPSPKGRP